MYLLVKRLLDLIGALFLFSLLWPVMVVCGILIKIEDPEGGVFFRQARITKGNKAFKVFKFRSMRIQTESNGEVLSDSQRMLKVGYYIRKFSLDELPQLFNIVMGDMSFIGPRPLPTIYYPYYSEDELKRHNVRAGISGWAQVNGRNNLTWDEKFKYDLYYVENISLYMDIKIVFKTLKKVLLGSDVAVRGDDIEDISLHEIRDKVR